MTEPDPTYAATFPDVDLISPPEPLPPVFQQYLEHRRRVVIMELRQIDRQLGRPQTIPERSR